MIGAAIVGGLASASASKKAAKAQTDAASQQAAVQRYAYDTTRKDLKGYRDAGTNALGAVNYELGLGAKPANYAGFQATPGYAWQLDQGTKAIDRSAANSGNLFSGETGKALQGYGQGLASQEYGNYFNRLYGLTNMGQNAAAQTGQAAQNYANGASNAFANMGNAQAAGAIGQGNAISNGIGNIAGILQYQNMTGGGGLRI
jgi:hypothetical protein